jgi:8-oxo-dGTP diphosphatase
MQAVGAAVIIKNGKYLIAKRKPGGSLANKWEFPGGKIEAGETPEKGLERELYEEFEITVRVMDFITSHPFENNGKRYMLNAYYCETKSCEFILHEHTAIAWIEPDEFGSYDLAESDRAIVEKVIEFASRKKQAPNLF